MSASISPAVAWAWRYNWLNGFDLGTESQQARDEGRDTATLEAEFERLLATPGDCREEAWLADAGALIDRVQSLPVRADYPYHEPDDLEGIRAARPAQAPSISGWRRDDAEHLRRMHGALLGRIAGCLFGKPVETWQAESIRITAEAQGNWPLTHYLRQLTPEEAARIDAQSPPQRFTAERPPPTWLRDGIDGMVEDDDINYTVVGFGVVKKFGPNFTPSDVGAFWCDEIPIMHLCTAERVAYRNFVGGFVPPQSATRRNPFREWIGAQIRADFFGYAKPGDPVRAAEWAWRDASISHVRNGIYGEMWVAAMLAAAFVENDWKTIIRAGLGQIPEHCRLAEAVARVLAWHDAGRSYEEAWAGIHAQWDERNWHHWCHTIPNAQIVALGLLYGEDDYEKTITRAVMPGFDTDCNGATCGSLWGVMHGVEALPEKWTAPLRDHARTGLAGYHDISIRLLAEEMVNVSRQS